MSDNREAFFARIRAARGGDAGAESPTPPKIEDAIVRTVSRDVDRAELFIERSRATGMEVHDLRTVPLRDAVSALFERLGIGSITLAVGDDSESSGLIEAVAASGCSVVDHRASDRLEAHYDVDAGVTDSLAAIAETGTVVVSSTSGRSRGSFIVPPIHIVLIRARDIAADHLDFWRDHAPATMPASTVFVSGPSKTADIEGILITGVHGPGAVHVLVV